MKLFALALGKATGCLLQPEDAHKSNLHSMSDTSSERFPEREHLRGVSKSGLPRTADGAPFRGMSNVEEIKAAIYQLPLEERAALIAELCGWTDDEWDRRMKADAKAGEFAAMNEAVAQALRPHA